MSNASDQAKFLYWLRQVSLCTPVDTADVMPAMIGNLSLRRVIGWANETRYWRTHAALLAAGAIVNGRGRGGTVGIAPPARKRRAA